MYNPLIDCSPISKLYHQANLRACKSRLFLQVEEVKIKFPEKKKFIKETEEMIDALNESILWLDNMYQEMENWRNSSLNTNVANYELAAKNRFLEAENKKLLESLNFVD